MRANEFITEAESYQPPELNVGDKILKGKFKNSPAEIKGFTKDKHNQPVLKTNKGDVQLFKPRISKLMAEDASNGVDDDGEVVDEGIKSKAAAAALAATLGGGAAAADTTDWSVMQRYLKDRDVAAQQTTKAKTPAASKSNLDFILKDLRTQGDKLANARQLPQKKAAQVYQPVTDSNLETVLHSVAANTGMRGHELAAFMSQCAHESANFSSMHEYSSGKSYEGRRDLGNIYRGDGERFKGRGFIQITGRENYRKAGEALNLPLEQNPELASKPMVAAKIALWYWKTRVRPNVDNFSDTRQVTKPINPNMNGLADRHDKFKSYLAALGLKK